MGRMEQIFSHTLVLPSTSIDYLIPDFVYCFGKFLVRHNKIHALTVIYTTADIKGGQAGRLPYYNLISFIIKN